MIFSHFLHNPADAENVLNLVNIDEQHTCLHFKRAIDVVLKKFDEHDNVAGAEE